uniref:Tripartite motif-containing protein 2 n=1 Tax=Magallana gigas TaxID=29159 RepID=K1QEH0_MAGGI
MAEDTDFSLQDLLRCNLCETHVPSLHYKTYHKQLCEICYEKHLLIESKEVEVGLLPFENSGEPIENSLGIKPLITLQGWKPQSVSGSSIGGLLIVLDSDDDNHAKVIHFCESRVKQTIQFDADDFPLYSSGSIKYISENRNLDICVSDCVAGAVVVVNQTGKFRFKYRGIYSKNSCRSFKPFGITTDGEGRILTSDWNNQLIHTLDRDGRLLGYIDCGFVDPYGVCVGNRGNLFVDRTVNLVNDTDDIEPVIALQGWKPQSVSGSSIGGLLIVMDSYDYNHAKVIHFCGYRVIQTIQFDADGFPLYSSGSIKYISENSNLDVCVSDCVAGAVVVVNQTGKFRFRYKGIYSENSCRPFKPFGITTDSQGWILTSDWYNQIIHILDQDGQLLGYIDCGFIDPYGVCVDTRGNLFVTRCFEACRPARNKWCQKWDSNPVDRDKPPLQHDDDSFGADHLNARINLHWIIECSVLPTDFLKTLIDFM